MSASRSTSVLGFIATVCLAVTPALAQTELAWCATNLTVFATGGARVECESVRPVATGEVCWLEMPFAALQKPGHDPQIEVLPASAFDGPARIGELVRRRGTPATNITGLLAANAGAMVEVRAGTNECFRGRLKLSGELALIEETTNRTVAVAASAVSVLRRLDGLLRTQNETAERLPALVARCVDTGFRAGVRLAYTVPDASWSPAYELATNAPSTARLTLRARLKGDFAGLRNVPARFALAPGGPAWELANIAQGSPVLFSEEVPCESLVQVIVLDQPEAPPLAHPALRLANRTGFSWPAGPLGKVAFPATPPGGVATLVLEESAPLRVDRRIKEISRRPASQSPDGEPREEVRAVGTIVLTNGSPSPLRAWVLRASPGAVEETSPTAVQEHDAKGGQWLRWEMSVPAGGQVVLEFSYRALLRAPPTKEAKTQPTTP
ncbi:MAG: DUF4139 domain-containing protein [Verrucomicrobia bacterium]|nr:DUF4139 domain-containing protein [Verrucomicrobiota bacterium]